MMEIHGKIYVVVLVLTIIFTGLGLFLFYLDRKLARMEKKIDHLEKKSGSESIAGSYQKFSA
jgi:CcmD family protein